MAVRNKAGILLLLLVACSARLHGVGSVPARQHAAATASVRPSEPSGPDSAVRVDGGDDAELSSRTDFEIPDGMKAWVLVGTTCEYMVFHHSNSPVTGEVFILGYHLTYERHADQLTLFGISYDETLRWDVIAKRRVAQCMSKFHIGPDFITLGGADVFLSDSACQAALTTAVPLDDSAAVTVKECRNISVPVATDEVECVYGDRYALRWKHGCITELRSIGQREIRNK